MDVFLRGHERTRRDDQLMHNPKNESERLPLTYGGSDEGRRVSDVLEALALDEIRHAIGEVLIVGFHIVLQYQPAQRPRWFVLGAKKRQIVKITQ